MQEISHEMQELLANRNRYKWQYLRNNIKRMQRERPSVTGEKEVLKALLGGGGSWIGRRMCRVTLERSQRRRLQPLVTYYIRSLPNPRAQ